MTMREEGKRWVRAREAMRMVDINSQGRSIIDWAAEGIVDARCKRLTNFQPDADGYVPVPLSFWEELKSFTGSLYRDWAGGTFRIRHKRDMRSIPREITALGVEFDGAQIEEMGGKLPTPLQAVTPGRDIIPAGDEADSRLGFPRGEKSESMTA